MNIALTGYAGSGKSTLAQYLVKEQGYIKIAFADPLREIVKEQGFSIQKPYPLETRIALQVAGKTIRQFAPNYFLDEIEKKITHPVKIIIDDLRLLKEADFLRERGFLIARISTPPNIRSQRLNGITVSEEQETEKEIALITPDIELDGEKTPEENLLQIALNVTFPLK